MQQLNPAVQSAADKAIFTMQLSTVPAAKFVVTEVPGTTMEMAMLAIRVTARPALRPKYKRS